MKARIRWMLWAKRKGWEFPDSVELHELWPLKHYDVVKGKASQAGA